MRRSPELLAASTPGHRPSGARGFSFVELLFAVAVMGIGFIMIAAVFPVGLQQTKLTLDETSAAAAARATTSRMDQLGSVQIGFGGANRTSAMPHSFPTAGLPAPTVEGTVYNGIVRTFNDQRPFTNAPVTGALADNRRRAIWRAVSGEAINPADPRNAVAVLYKRDAVAGRDPANPFGPLIYAGRSTAQLIIITSQIGNSSQYQLSTNSQPIYDTEPRPVAVQIAYDQTNQAYVATFFSCWDLDGGSTLDRGGYPNGSFPSTPALDWEDVLNAAVGAVTEGAFFVISDDRITTPGSQGRMNGRIFRVGNRRNDLGVNSFDLAPGYGFTPDAGVDGILNSASNTSNDDIVGIGVDQTVNAPKSGLAYTAPAKIERPLGTNGPNGTGIVVAGTAANKGAVALVLGRGFVNPFATPGVFSDYTGAVQDVSAYTTFLSVSN